MSSIIFQLIVSSGQNTTLMLLYISKSQKGMYDLKQATVLAYNNIVTVLKEYGYSLCLHTAALSENVSRKIKFCVWFVDNFGVKFGSQDDTTLLLNALKDNYKITIDWKSEDYCGLTINWNYD